MVTFNYAQSLGKTLAFNPEADILDFAKQDLTNLTITEVAGSVSIANKFNEVVTLSNTTLAQFSSKATASTATANLKYTAAGRLVFGDDSVTASGDAGSNTIDVSGVAGNHVLFGLGGSDTITTGNSSDKVVVYGGTGMVDSTDGADSITVGNGNSTVYANAGNDTVSVAVGDGKTSSVFGGLGNDSIATSGSSNGSVAFTAGSGNDTITTANFAGNFTLIGGSATGDSTDGNDLITTGTGGGLIYANAGNDLITLNTQKDVSVFGGLGNDTIASAATLKGNLFVAAGTGADSVTLTVDTGSAVTVFGGMGEADSTDGADEIRVNVISGTANAVVYGNAGNDLIITSATGGVVASTIFGGLGNDTLTTGTGNDSVVAGNGNNTINVLSGNDTIVTGNGNNTIAAFNGDVNIVLGTGADLITAGTIVKNSLVNLGSGSDIATFTTITGANNTIIGGAGVDTITISAVAATGNAVIWGGASETDSATQAKSITLTNNLVAADGSKATIFGAGGNDTITTDVGDASFTQVTVSSGAGDDSITTGLKNDSIDGGDGKNIIATSGGADTIISGSGDDSIDGGNGADSIISGAGNDTILGSKGTPADTGIDIINAGSGDDIITSGSGADIITGGSGNDQFRFEAPATNGIDVIKDFLAGTDRVALFETGGGFNATGSAGLTVGTTLVAADYVEGVANVTALTTAAHGNKVVEISAALTATQISTGTSAALTTPIYVAVFNSTTSKGEVWFDADWTDATARVQVATLDDVTTATQLTGLTFANFAEYV